jgi:hypothetical protein
MFKKRIKGWNLFKNLKESEKEEIIRKPQEEEDEIVDHANMLIEGRLVQLHKIQRYQRTNASQIHRKHRNHPLGADECLGRQQRNPHPGSPAQRRLLQKRISEILEPSRSISTSGETSKSETLV